MSIIQQPITQNYIYQSQITQLTNDKSLTNNGIYPNSDFVLKYNNNNYQTLANNGYKYTFIYNFNLEDFLNPTEDSIRKCEIISHDQISKNFSTNLMYYVNTSYSLVQVPIAFTGRNYYRVIPKNNYAVVTPGYLENISSSATTRSQQYGTNGITLLTYVETIITNLPIIVAGCPDMSIVQDYYPMSYLFEYDYVDLQGNTTKKTASFTAMKYTVNNVKKVLFFGTGLQEFIV